MQKSRRKSKIAIIGLGYVGLPLAVQFIRSGFQVMGIDKDEFKIKSVQEGHSYINDLTDSALRKASAKGLCVSTGYANVKDATAIIICVPTPLSSKNTPDMTAIQSCLDELTPYLNKGQLLVLESSTYPGTTKEIILPPLISCGLEIGKDIFVGYSPERIDPGNMKYEMQDIPKIVSGVTEECLKRITNLYSRVFKKIIPVSSTEVAEITKLLENSFRFINISFINEIAMLCDKMKLNVWEVIEAAQTKPYGFMAFSPGPGVGGHCIPVDPLYLAWRADQLSFQCRYIELSQDTNLKISEYIVEQVTRLISKNKSLQDSNVLIYGVTYKKDVGDVRESPALLIMNKLLQQGVHLEYFDPYIAELRVGNDLLIRTVITPDQIRKADCVLILTDHSQIPLQELANHATLIYDTKNVFKDFTGSNHIITLGSGKV
jgi:UDP-N-acetyl-D-glucosamine dehydrogenase